MYLHSWEAGSSHLVAPTYAQDGGKEPEEQGTKPGGCVKQTLWEAKDLTAEVPGQRSAVPSPPIRLEKEKKESMTKYFQSTRNSTGNTACRDPSASPEGAFARSCHSVAGGSE